MKTSSAIKIHSDANAKRLSGLYDDDVFEYRYECYAYILSILGYHFKDKMLVDGILQDLLLYLYENRISRRDIRNMNGYLYKVTRDFVINFLRRRQARRERETRYVMQRSMDVKSDDDPLFIAMQRDNRSWSFRCLKRVEQLVIVLHYYEGFSISKIATCLDVSTRTVIRYHADAIQKLRRRLTIPYSYNINASKRTKIQPFGKLTSG